VYCKRGGSKMVYLEKFVVAVKVDGKILREYSDIVYLPFGSEYSVLLKNLDSRKCVVDLDIDGENVLDNSRIIIHPNDSVELYGFKKNSRVTNKFKFIEKTKEISDYRRDRIDDGIIRVEVTFERPQPVINWNCLPQYYSLNDTIKYNWDYTAQSITLYNCGAVSNSCTTTMGYDDGITVKGSDNVDQTFQKGYIGLLEDNSTVIILKLKGINENKNEVLIPVTVKNKLRCKTCGRMWESKHKYCGSCGTFLE